MTKHEMNIAIQAIRQFVYYTYNYCDMRQVCDAIWEKWLADHFFSKLRGYEYDICRWYVEMSTNHQDELARWIVDNYHGVDSRAPKEEAEDSTPDTFIDYCKQHIAEKIYDMVGSDYYGADLAYQLTQEENVNGTLTFSSAASKELIRKYWEDAGEYWDYEKFNFGEHTHNPFDNPEAYFVCMVIEGCASLLGHTEALEEVWNSNFELTKELADTIIEQVNEQTKIW